MAAKADRVRRMEILDHFGAVDLAAVALLALGALGIGHWIEQARPGWTPSVTVLMGDYRRRWMRELVTRQPRIFDATILSTLRQSTSFFASTCVIAIGGVLALVGNADRMTGLAANFPGGAVDAAPAVLQIKLLLPALFLTTAFLQFVWANRLFGYCAVLMAAVPNEPDAPEAYPMAAQAAELNIRASWNFNRGLRAMYFALAALPWLIHAWALAFAAGVTLYTLWRREFASASHRILTQTTHTTE